VYHRDERDMIRARLVAESLKIPSRILLESLANDASIEVVEKSNQEDTMSDNIDRPYAHLGIACCYRCCNALKLVCEDEGCECHAEGSEKSLLTER
ncbi:MAG: hypothetical protein ACRERD_25200, partial [Candidatus Binatia bacterium]